MIAVAAPDGRLSNGGHRTIALARKRKHDGEDRVVANWLIQLQRKKRAQYQVEQLALLELPDDMRAVVLQRRVQDSKDYAALGSAADEPEGPIVVVQDKVHPKSMEGVLRSLPEFQRPVKSVLQLLIEGAGHLLILSPKYHAELAGVGIEYCFGRVKWWFRNKNTMSTQSLKEKSRMSFGPDVVAIDHARKFARRARDYVRAYMWGATGLEVEIKIKLYKTHRSALDTDFKFVSE